MAESVEDLIVKKPLLIAGPCSAETENQVHETIQQLAKTLKVDFIRAGIWKPRTRPGMFEGVGSPGLTWLKEAGRAAGIPVMVEVATARHVDESLQNGIDAIWIGARTTVNPFSVQEIADALHGTKIPVFIKNPINPDIDLWAGALERVEKSGVKSLALIHRGFSSYGNTKYRNPPMWHLAIEMKRRFPGLPMICDPSHICGNRELLQYVAQKSIDLDYTGLMIESHIDPDTAWSDAKQQVTPGNYLNLINGLTWRTEEITKKEVINALMQLRGQIDELDDELLNLLSERMKIADKIGIYKKENNITILQTARWNDIRERALDKMEQLGLSKEFIIRYFDAVHLESIHHQTKIMNDL